MMSDSFSSESANDLRNRINKEMAKMMNQPQLIPRPPIQRKNCWSNKENSDFIDTIVRNWRCSPIFIIRKIDEEQDEEEDDILVDHIFDGAHKIEAVVKFMNDEFALEKLPEMSPLKDEYEGKKFKELPIILKNQIRNYKFTINYIDKETANDKDALKILWERLNKAGKKLNDFELALPVIHDLVHSVLKPSLPYFLESDIFTKEESKRGQAEKLLQLILATSETTLEEAQYLRDFSSKKNLVKKWQDKRLGNKISDIKANTSENTEKWLSNLKRASQYMKALKENNCFNDVDGNPILQPAHRGTELVFLLGRCIYHFPKPEEFRRICPQLAKEMKDTYFTKMIRNEAGRNGILQKKLLKDIDELVKRYAELKTPRLFPKEWIEKKLIEQKNECAICKEKIHKHQSYEGDHIIKYAEGGETKYENLQVTHARCNQLK